MKNSRTVTKRERRYFIGGSDARIIMGDDEAALIRLWKEKRGEAEPEDLSANLIVQLGAVTEDLNRRWYEANTGQVITDVQKHAGMRVYDGWRQRLTAGWSPVGRCSKPSSCCPGISRRKPQPRNVPQLQHNMWVVAARSAVLSVITGGGSGLRSPFTPIPLPAPDPDCRTPVRRCVETGEPPVLFGIEPPKPRIAAVRIVDMSSSNAWAEFAVVFSRTRSAHLEHEQAKTELKGLMPEDAQQAIGHGVRGKRSKSGAVSFDLLNVEDGHAAL